MSPFEIGAIDIVIVVILLAGAILGRFSGFLKTLVSLASWVVGIVLGIMFGETIGSWMFPNGFTAITWLPNAIGFVLLLVVVLVAGAFAQQFIKKALDSTGLTPVDRILGMVLGCVTAAFVIIAVGIIFELGNTPDEIWKNSRLLQFLMQFEVFVRDIFGTLPVQVIPPETTTTPLSPNTP